MISDAYNVTWWCRPEVYVTVQTGACHGVDRGMSRCEPEHITVQTGAYHGANRRMSRCKPEHVTVETGVCHGANQELTRCKPENITVQTEECRGADPSMLRTTYRRDYVGGGCGDTEGVTMPRDRA